MPMIKDTLKDALIAALRDYEVADKQQNDMLAKVTDIADKMAIAIDAHIRSADINVTGLNFTGTINGQPAVGVLAGKLTGALS